MPDIVPFAQPGLPATRMNTEDSDRRQADRFPIQREVRFKLLGKRQEEAGGTGTTLNISSNGVLFSTTEQLREGTRIELSISWPAQLDNKCQLKLVAKGKIVRISSGCAAVEIQQYEFRTAGRTAPAAA